MLIRSEHDRPDLLEVFCSSTSTMAQTANNAGMDADRWTKDNFDLTRPSGYLQVAHWLKQLRPRRLWLSPGPYSITQDAHQRELAFRMWQSCIRLAKLQLELGGTFYIKQPQRERSRSRSPPRGKHDSLLAKHLELTQGQHVNDAYFTKLTDYVRTPRRLHSNLLLR